MLFAIGQELNTAGKHVCFYEDYPYAEAYERNTQKVNWLPKTVAVAIEPKVKAASAYATQIHGLGGSAGNLEKRLRAFGDDWRAERYWQILAPASSALNGNREAAEFPLRHQNSVTAIARLQRFSDNFSLA